MDKFDNSRTRMKLIHSSSNEEHDFKDNKTWGGGGWHGGEKRGEGAVSSESSEEK